MNTNIIVALDTRYKKKDGSYPVILRLSRDERTLPIATGISIPSKDWDDKKREVKKSYVGVTSVTRLNNSIQSKRKNARDILLKLNEDGQLHNLSLADIKQRIVQENTSSSILAYGEGLVKELIEARRIGTARSYAGVIRVLKSFNNDKDLKFQDVTYSFLTKFETDHYKKGNTANGLGVYMRTIRAIYNKAVKAGLVDKENYPFTGYKIKTAPTEKRALDWEMLKRIIALDLKPDHKFFHTRNYFIASYMMYGMNYTDMAYLQKSNISNGRINYRRRKTSKLYDIKITPALDEILSYYIAANPDAQFVFSVIKRDTPALQHKDIQWARRRYDKKLKDLAKLCKIPHNLTSYVSRHSFATQAMLQEVPLNAISSMLGHSSLKTTEVYLKSLPSNILDSYNEKVLQGS